MEKERERLLIHKIKKLRKDIRFVFIALAVTNLSSPPTSLNRGIYTEDDFIKDLILYLPQKFTGFKKKKVIVLWRQFKKIIYGGGKFDIFKELPGLWYKIYREHYSLILKEIQDQILLLKPQEKLGLFLFLKNRDLFQSAFTREELILNLAKKFSEVSEQILNNFGEILVRTGLIFESSCIDTQQKPSGIKYKAANYLKELDQILISELRKEETISEYIKKIDRYQGNEMRETHCLHCGALIPINAILCPECGNKL